MPIGAYLTTYDGLLCGACAASLPRVSEVNEADLRDVYGYDRARCEECKTVLYDGIEALDG